MERLLLDQLDWRVQVPTAYTFLHLLTQVRVCACVYMGVGVGVRAVPV